MKQINLVLLLMLLALPLSVNAKGSASSGGKKTSTSSGFKSGFSSQKKSEPQSGAAAPARQSGNTVSLNKPTERRKGGAASPSSSSAAASDNAGRPATFGSFGGKSDAPVNLQKSTSKLSVDLGKSSANQNALTTLDARKAAQTAAAAPPLPVPTAPSMPATPQQQQQPIIVQQQESGIMSNSALWFMLGKSLNERPRERRTEYGNGNTGPVANRGATPVTEYGNGNGVGNTGPVANRGATPVMLPQGQESFGWSALRVVLWLMIFSALGGVVYYFVKRRKGGADSVPSANYTLRDG